MHGLVELGYRNLYNNTLDDVHTSPVKEQNIQTRPNDYILTLEEIVTGINSIDEEKNYEATQSARKMLSRERNPPIDDIVGVSNLIYFTFG